ncbi:ribonuclease H-like domain-containing protein [Tanacetum coccineum]
MFTCTLAQYVAHKINVAQQFTPQMHYRLPHPDQGILGPAPAIYASKPTTLPSALSTMSLSQLGIFKPIDRLSLHTSSIYPIPKNPPHALKDPNWCNSMYDEYNALVKNGTWLLIPRSACVNMVRSMWLFKHKFHDDGTLSRYKARLVANSSSQQQGVDFDETFSLVVKLATIRMVLSLAVSHQWPIHQLDVKISFLNGDLSKTVYMHQPPGFIDNRYPHHVCLLQKSLYGLKQAPRAWFQRFLSSPTSADYRFVLSQKKYALHLLERAHMVTCNPSRTPVDTDSKLGLKGALVQDPTLYRSLAGGLQYLSFTRPELSYAVQQIFLYMHDPREPHLAALNRILRYVQGTLDLGLHLYVSSTTSLVGYTDADWAGCPSTRMSTSGYCVFFVITYYLSPLKDNTLFHAPVPKLNTGVLLTL